MPLGGGRLHLTPLSGDPLSVGMPAGGMPEGSEGGWGGARGGDQGQGEGSAEGVGVARQETSRGEGESERGRGLRGKVGVPAAEGLEAKGVVGKGSSGQQPEGRGGGGGGEEGDALNLTARINNKVCQLDDC